MSLGKNVHIGENAYISAGGGLFIGDNTHISRNVMIYTANHRFINADRLPFDEQNESRPVRIGKNVWIGINVTIAPGTTIGDGAIIAMGTVVSGDVPPLAIVANQKWRQIGQRDRDHYERLETLHLYGGVNGHSLSSER